MVEIEKKNERQVIQMAKQWIQGEVG